nr:hypothetical protein CFP56_23345 [Quercus suber]
MWFQELGGLKEESLRATMDIGRGHTVWERLDRAVATIDWLTAFPASKVVHLECGTSDHKPILIMLAVFKDERNAGIRVVIQDNKGLGVALPHSVNEVDTMAAVRAIGFVHQQSAKDVLGLILVI